VDECDRGEFCPGTVRQRCPPDAGQPLSTPCEADGDECTVDHCDGTGDCVFLAESTDPVCQLDCGDGVTDPCRVTQVSPPGKVFGSFQKAIDAAPDGATLRLEGRCVGPIRIIDRANLTIEGVPPPPSVCPRVTGVPPPEALRALAPGPSDLTSTVAGGCDSSDIGECETIKVTRSRNIVFRYLNVVDGVNTGLEFKRSVKGTAHCNCFARHPSEGVELDLGAGGHLVTQNLVKDSGNERDAGIRVHQTRFNTVMGNTVELNNAVGGITLEDDAHDSIVTSNLVRMNDGDGISITDSDRNFVMGNVVEDNLGDGIRLDDADDNEIVARPFGNIVQGNAGSGVSVRGSDDNVIDGNAIAGNGDALLNVIDCRGGSEDNTGSNVPPGSPCR
jgi:parallel beta-helix repeat protein